MADIVDAKITNREGAQAVAAGRRNMDDFKRATSNARGQARQDPPNEGSQQYMQEAAALSDQVAQQNFNRDEKAYNMQSQRQQVNDITKMQFAQGGQLGWSESQRLAREGYDREIGAMRVQGGIADKAQARDIASRFALADMAGGGGTPGSRLFGSGSGAGTSYPSAKDRWLADQENQRLDKSLAAQKDLAAMGYANDRYRTIVPMTKGVDASYWR